LQLETQYLSLAQKLKFRRLRKKGLLSQYPYTFDLKDENDQVTSYSGVLEATDHDHANDRLSEIGLRHARHLITKKERIWGIFYKKGYGIKLRELLTFRFWRDPSYKQSLTSGVNPVNLNEASIALTKLEFDTIKKANNNPESQQIKLNTLSDEKLNNLHLVKMMHVIFYMVLLGVGIGYFTYEWLMPENHHAQFWGFSNFIVAGVCICLIAIFLLGNSLADFIKIGRFIERKRSAKS